VVIPAQTPQYEVLPHFVSTWSERHAAYAAGLGSFGLSRSFITPLGSAGRFASIITDCPLPITVINRPEPFAHCLHFSRGICGACIKRCPGEAIRSRGMIKKDCSAFLDGVLAENSPRYGCGKCQTKVPCSRGIPIEVDEIFPCLTL
jgi:epoxyqueuosine reductase QueG